jgi:hypothetical protein
VDTVFVTQQPALSLCGSRCLIAAVSPIPSVTGPATTAEGFVWRSLSTSDLRRSWISLALALALS